MEHSKEDIIKEINKETERLCRRQSQLLYEMNENQNKINENIQWVKKLETE